MNLHSILANTDNPIWIIRGTAEDGYPMTWFVEAHTRQEITPIIDTITEAMELDHWDIIQMSVDWITTPSALIRTIRSDYDLDNNDH